ncbi:MAG: hypothetical protein FJ279_16180 [Planctomycetes bacterium]|nr:hypothetical protein [Planctomycetota bacterium]MBM4078121.1 hypothetical protein [Planctomycetota bacterium]MBM4085760.1 hypothetical protein [Planctomycetota bacterium]
MQRPEWMLDWFVMYAVILLASSTILLLILVLVITEKLNKVTRRLDEISSSASEFVKMGVNLFKDKH